MTPIQSTALLVSGPVEYVSRISVLTCFNRSLLYLRTESLERLMAGQNLTGIRRMWAAFFNSWAGFKATWRHEEAFRQECLLVLIGVPLGFWLGDNAIERALMIGVLFIVIIVELLNTAVEVTIDRIGFERHELSARAKDIGSAAVLTSLLLAGLVWCLMLTD